MIIQKEITTISGTIDEESTSGSWGINSGGADEDGDLYWGSGTFSGTGNSEAGWSGNVSGTDYWCKAV
jgi:hypothetical protein